MRRLALLLTLAALAAPSSAQAISVPAVAALTCKGTVEVTVGDRGSRLFFSRDAVTVRTDGCVRWNWTGVLPHRVVTPDGLRSARRTAPYTYRRNFVRPRVKPYQIHCSVHPRQMRMKVRVKPRRSGSAARL